MDNMLIHCFWAGGGKSALARRCLASWRKFAADRRICEWGVEGDSLVARLDGAVVHSAKMSTLSRFCVSAYRLGRWAMVSDWVRLYALKEFGGIYLDLDVELVKPIGLLPEGEWIAGEWKADGSAWMNPGSGLSLAKGSPGAAGMLERYAQIDFDPAREPEMMTWINEGLRSVCPGLRVLDPEVMSPIDFDGKLHLSDKTVGIHRYVMSWASPGRRVARWLNWHGMRWLTKGILWVKRKVGI